MTKLTFTTTGCWHKADGFGCASLGLPGCCTNEENKVIVYPRELKAVALTGSYEQILKGVKAVSKPVKAAIVVFGNAGGENIFMADLQKIVKCPMVGGGAAIDGATNTAGLSRVPRVLRRCMRRCSACAICCGSGARRRRIGRASRP